MNTYISFKNILGLSGLKYLPLQRRTTCFHFKLPKSASTRYVDKLLISLLRHKILNRNYCILRQKALKIEINQKNCLHFAITSPCPLYQMNIDSVEPLIRKDLSLQLRVHKFVMQTRHGNPTFTIITHV